MATKFYLSPKQDKSGDSPIRVSICIHGTRLISTTGHSISADKWIDKSRDANGTPIPIQRVKKGAYNSKGIPGNLINARIAAIESHFAEYESRISNRPSIDDLSNELASVKGNGRKRSRKTQQGQETLLNIFDRFILEQSTINQWSDGTLVGWQGFRKHIKAQGEKLQLSDFNDKRISEMIAYFRKDCGMGENTIRKEYQYLKWFLSWCIRNGLTDQTAILNYKPKFRILEKPVIFLTKDELMQLYRYEIPADGTIVTLHDEDGKRYTKTIGHSDTLQKVKDIFCLCSFTSLRYSDAAKLKKIDRVNNCINVVTKKTHDKLQIELNRYSREILDKYADVAIPFGLALPYVSNEVVNDYIKELGELCGFNTPTTRTLYRGGTQVEETKRKWECLCSHTGRKTFICNALGAGISPSIIMKWTGHSDYKTMKPYVGVADQIKSDAMETFNKAME